MEVKSLFFLILVLINSSNFASSSSIPTTESSTSYTSESPSSTYPSSSEWPSSSYLTEQTSESPSSSDSPSPSPSESSSSWTYEPTTQELSSSSSWDQTSPESSSSEDSSSASSRPPCRIYCPYPFVADYNRCQCRCNPSIICPSGCSPDPNTCICPQPSCPPHFIKDPLTNKCVCDQSYQYGCAYNQKWDNQTCHCACGKSEICKTGFYFDTIYCGCKCVQKTCEKNFIQNLNTCECVCDSSRVNKSCPSGYVFSYVTCQCEVVPNASC